MKTKKLVCLAFPLMLLGVGCSNKDIAEEKKTGSPQVAESEKKDESKYTKDIIDPIYEEIDKIYKEGEELKNKKKTEENINSTKKEEDSSKKVMKEPVDKAARTLAEERESEDKDIIKEVNPPVTLKQYQKDIRTLTTQFENELHKIKPIYEKDKSFKTNKEELRNMVKATRAQGEKIENLKPPKEYDYFFQDIHDPMKVIKMALNEVLLGVNTDNMEKIEQGMVGLYSGLENLGMVLKSIDETE